MMRACHTPPPLKLSVDVGMQRALCNAMTLGMWVSYTPNCSTLLFVYGVGQCQSFGPTDAHIMGWNFLRRTGGGGWGAKGMFGPHPEPPSRLRLVLGSGQYAWGSRAPRAPNIPTHPRSLPLLIVYFFFVGLDEPLEMSIMVFVIDVAWRRFSDAASCIFNTLKM